MRLRCFTSLLCPTAARSSLSGEPPSAATPSLMFHYPAAGQLDVPVGTRATVSFSMDVDAGGFIEDGEVLRDANRAAMRIKATAGDVDSASFDMDDCIPGTPAVEGCMYLLGSMPVAMGELERDCVLPSGETAAACIPVTIPPQLMLATSMSMDADAGISIGTDTGTTIMRVRERPGGVRGFIIDDAGSPVLVVDLDLYMDAPDMSIPLSDHDLHSKPVSMFDGAIEDEVPTGEMRLQLLSRPTRGIER